MIVPHTETFKSWPSLLDEIDQALNGYLTLDTAGLTLPGDGQRDDRGAPEDERKTTMTRVDSLPS